MSAIRSYLESEHGALAQFYQRRALRAPEVESQRLFDLVELHRKVANVPDRKAAVLLRLRRWAGKKSFSQFIRTIE